VGNGIVEYLVEIGLCLGAETILSHAGLFPALEGGKVERLRRSALLALEESLAEGVDLEASLLLALINNDFYRMVFFS